MSHIVRVSELNKYFGALHVLKDVSFAVAPAEVICIIGPSGSGKSTLLRCINFLENPDFGAIEVDGIEVKSGTADSHRREKIHKLRLQTAMVFQSFNLFPHMSALGNVIEGPVTVKKMGEKEASEIGMHFLEKVGLAHKRDEFPKRLSGGQQQRVAIARALAMQPKVMLFDEPTSALDPELIGEVLGVMQQLVKEGMTMLTVTHEMGFARKFAHRIMFMDEGRIIETGRRKLFDAPEDERTRSFGAPRRIGHRDE
ncbi:MAG: amino acid ABC transporter ATP-binding protein [Caldilineaceae bacterium]